MSDPYVGEIRAVGFSFAPRGWAQCNGQLLPIAQNTPLFSLLGLTYGGDGRSTFALPNLQGRLPMHWGNGAGLTPRPLGATGGSATVTLNQSQLPNHTHQAKASSDTTVVSSPVGNTWGTAVVGRRQTKLYAAASGGTNASLPPQTIGATGGGQPHDNLPPYQVVNYVIALVGVFPQRP